MIWYFVSAPLWIAALVMLFLGVVGCLSVFILKEEKFVRYSRRDILIGSLLFLAVSSGLLIWAAKIVGA